ncbi:MAG: cell division protein FtsL [Betaproteobacteria bacterium]|nr:cell division protein FtsL [Betaproteobacteria bacterium]
MNRMTFILLLVLVAASLSLVTAQHQARQQFIALEAEQEAARKLDHEWRELQLEAQTLTAAKRIEQKATRERGMVQPDAKRTVILVMDGGAASTPARAGTPASGRSP